MLRVLIAPDSFKGSLSAFAAAHHMAIGIRKAMPNCDVDLLPIADGGEGTVDCMVEAIGGKKVTTRVHNPLGEWIEAQYGVLTDGTVVIEAAAANGLELIEKSKRDPLIANTIGVGELIQDALDANHTSFIIGLGGSGTNDGGIGMLHALGIRLLDAKGDILSPIPLACRSLDSFDISHIHPKLHTANIRIATDVDNSLCGINGATVVFGPQKGVQPEWIEPLDQALAQFGNVLEKQFGVSILNRRGSGAAGGMGAAFVGILGATLDRGIDLILNIAKFDQRAALADLILTGEGKTDSQTLQGKAVYGVVRRAAQLSIPVLCVSGSYESSANPLYDLGLDGLLSIIPGPVPLEQALFYADHFLEQTSYAAFRIFMAGRSRERKK